LPLLPGGSWKKEEKKMLSPKKELGASVASKKRWKPTGQGGLDTTRRRRSRRKKNKIKRRKTSREKNGIIRGII
jgi:hypothetical protein